MDWFSCFSQHKKTTVIQAHKNIDLKNVSKIYPKNEKQISIARATSQEQKGQIQKQMNRISPLRQIPQSFGGFTSIQELRQKTQGNIVFLKIQKSNYEEELERCIKKKIQFTDLSFPTQIKGPIISYKRIKQIIPDAILMPDTISPNQITQGLLNDCYWLSSISSLAQRDYRIKKLFGTDKVNDQGIYMCKLTYNGVYQQVVIDDYFPVDANGQLIFAKPYKGKYIWSMILQKCWAKLYNSYERTNFGYNIEALYALTHAPVKEFFLEDFVTDIDQKDKLFQILSGYDQKEYVMVGAIWAGKLIAKQFKLQSGHAYSILGVYEINFKGSQRRLVQIRNPYGSVDQILAEPKLGYNSQNKFWKEISQQQRNRLQFNLIEKADSGVFYLQCHLSVCLVNDNSHYLFDSISDFKNGQARYYIIKVKNPQSFYALLVQGNRNKIVSKQQINYASILVIVGKISYDQNNKPAYYEYISSKRYTHLLQTNYFEMDLKLKVTGDYLVRIIVQNPKEYVTPITIGFYTPDDFAFKQEKSIDDFQFLYRVLMDRAKKLPADSPDKKPLSNASGWMCIQSIIQSNICYIAFQVRADSKYQKYNITIDLNNNRDSAFFMGYQRGLSVVNQEIERGHEVIFIYSYKTGIENPDVLPDNFIDTRQKPIPKFSPIA